MPTAYKGKIRITCRMEACVIDPVRADVGPDCYLCSDSQSEIIDLGDRVVIGIGLRPDDEQKAPLQDLENQNEKSAAKRLKSAKKED